ncbi:AI-2E family transporter [Deinococcus deserti]|uniref:Putative permease putative membrane protein n=1 Tax=Deinococcus deserti (strain DSM 17065 / CIP 109153 / LMG 22923 / VCD115) TaxID=546414 RepID=C1D3V8_DEIDV|nr:AI-2E family transporter [Deinococcus deserti]ACO48187.1 putative permease; putative membrane protein [Deinococcus deserti VCD115]
MLMGSVSTVAIVTIAVLLTLGGLHVTQDATLPLVFGAVIALFFRPLQRRLEQRLPRWLSVALIILLFLAFLALILGSVVYAVNVVAQDLPRYAERLKGYGIRLPDSLSSGSPSGSNVMGVVFGGLRAVLSPLGLTGLLLVFLVLLLAEADAWRRRLVQAFGAERGRRLTDAFGRMGRQFEQFMWVQTVTGLITAVLTWGICALVGLPFPFVWAVLTFVLEFFPTIGSLLSVVPPVLFAFAFGGAAQGALVLLGLTVVQLGVGSLLNPKWQGDRLKLSPTVVAFSVVFWGWLWGVGGAIIAVPLTAGIALLLSEFSSTRPLAVLLGHSEGPEGS